MKTNQDNGDGWKVQSHRRGKDSSSYANALQSDVNRTPTRGNSTKNVQQYEKSATVQTRIMTTPQPMDGKRYRIVKSGSTKVRMEYHTQLMRLVADIMAVYTVYDKGHNKVSCDLWNK